MNDRVRELECVISDLKQQSRDAEKVRDCLLNALREMLVTAESVNWDETFLESARAAIAKATGEQP